MNDVISALGKLLETPPACVDADEVAITTSVRLFDGAEKRVLAVCREIEWDISDSPTHDSLPAPPG